MPNINDVASACGVSIRTVSRVMNERAHVRGATRQRVLEAAERMGYKPDPNAQALQSGRKKMVGVVANSVSSDATLQRIEVVSKLFNAAGYAVLVQFAETGEVEEAAVRSCAPRCDALVIFTNLRSSTSSTLDGLAGSGYPFILVDPPRSVPYPSIHLDRRSGYRDAVRYLAHKGYGRLVLVLEDFRSSERLAGFQEGLALEGRSFDEAQVVRTGKGFSGGVSAAAEVAAILAEGAGPGSGQKAKGILCHNDKIALGLMNALMARGIRIPQDAGIVGFDDDAYGAFVAPPLTTIAPGGGDMGAYIFEQIQNRIEYGSPVGSRTFATGLIIRESA